MNEKIDAVVVGAGAVGLAVARALALSGLEVIVLERHRRAGQEYSARNSGVIHAGLYYRPGSLKATLCVRGRTLLYEYCNERGISHRRCGKLIVAQQAQLPALRALYQRGRDNGVDDLVCLTSEEARQLEPQVRCDAALFSPSTGIIDVHELLLALQGDLEASGASIVFDSELHSVQTGGDGFTLAVRSSNEVTELETDRLVNCAGLDAIGLLQRIEGYPRERRRRAHFAKGNYFALQGRSPFSHLVYPMPDEAGLGVHATLDLGGAVRFGPDVQWVESIDYSVEPARAMQFYSAIREYWPALPDDSLRPDYAGIRPKLTGRGNAAADFVIEGAESHGVDGLINLLGIESPGLTSSLAIAEFVTSMAIGAAAPVD